MRSSPSTFYATRQKMIIDTVNIIGMYNVFADLINIKKVTDKFMKLGFF